MTPPGRRDRLVSLTRLGLDHRMHSLRSRLAVLWVLSLTASLIVAGLLWSLYRLSAAAQAGRAEAVVSRACDLVAERWNFYAAGWGGPEPDAQDAKFRADMRSVLDLALPDDTPLEAGIWRPNEGIIASIGQHASELEGAVASAAGDARGERHAGIPDTNYALAVCPLNGPVTGLVAYAALPPLGAAATALQEAMAALLGLMLAISVLLTWLQLAWGRRVRQIETALVRHAAGELPRLAPTGERELDRIVAALNLAGSRLAEARHRSETLAAEVAQGQRLAALGRVAAGVAHEIRNPIAAMRLRAENALAGDDARRRAALEAILAQIARLTRLTGELLTMTQRREVHAETVDLPVFLATCAADTPGTEIEAAPAQAWVDPALTRRALDSLLVNAAAVGARRIVLRGRVVAGGVVLEVEDDGPGVPAALRETLFEPFVTGRAEGTGLGLSIARELVEAQRGRIELAQPGGEGQTTLFRITLPDERG